MNQWKTLSLAAKPKNLMVIHHHRFSLVR
jgi:hypothetical protein